jgi:hypothetical protein
VWQYSTYHGFQEIKILKDSLDNEGNKYIFIYQLDSPDYKIDTSFNIYKTFYGRTNLKYKLNAQQGESWTVYPETEGGNRRDIRADSVFEEFIWNEIRIVKKFGIYDLARGDTVISDLGYLGYDYLISGLGIYLSWDVHEGPLEILTGCIINGDTLGDIVSAVNDGQILTTFNLYQNYPNPFNPTTTINYQLSYSDNVSLKIFDILGNEIARLLNEEKSAGSYSINFNAAQYNLSSGIYFCELKTNGGESRRIKMILMK